MPRAKHSQYDRERKLPDNTGQPQGSGTIVWFHEQIVARLGDSASQALITESRRQGNRKTAWLCEQLRELGHQDLVEAYEQRRRDDAAALRIREKERVIRQCQAQIAKESSPERRAFLEKQVAKAQRYVKEHTHA